MKREIMTAGALALVLCWGWSDAPAQRWALKGYDNIGVGRPMRLETPQAGQSSGSSYNQFGLDLGYTFWRRGAQSLEANVGVGYSYATASLRLADTDYSYAAPSSADMDGNEYIRHCSVKGLEQKAGIQSVTVPVYLEYQWRPLRWLGIHAEAGVGLSFAVRSGLGSVRGSVDSYGVFPEYDDLVIDADYLDDFGEVYLHRATPGSMRVQKFGASVLCGAGLEFYTYAPVSFEVGVRYNAGLTQVFDGRYDVRTAAEYTAETAPVIYTVDGGTQVRSLTDYTTKSRLSPLSIRVGINVRF